MVFVFYKKFLQNIYCSAAHHFLSCSSLFFGSFQSWKPLPVCWLGKHLIYMYYLFYLPSLDLSPLTLVLFSSLSSLLLLFLFLSYFLRDGPLYWKKKKKKNSNINLFCNKGSSYSGFFTSIIKKKNSPFRY